MKKYFTIIFILFSSITLLAQFTSVQSGKWYWASTWSTDPNATAIPDSNDTAIIKHDVNLDGAGCRCLNLIVDSGGRVHNGTVTVYGDLQNYGTINGRSEWDGMYINLKGNLQNESIYDADTRFYGISDQTVICEDTLRLERCYDYDPTSKIIFSSSTILADSYIFLLGSELNFADTLTIINSTLDGGTLDGYGNVLLGVGYNNVLGWKGAVSFGPQYTILKNISLEGTHYIYGSGNIEDAYAIAISDNVVNKGTLTNAYVHTGGHSSVHVLSDFTNNGILQEQQDGLSFKVNNSSIVNTGSMDFTGFTFNGECGFSSTDSIALSRFNGTDSSTIVNATSNIYFKDRTVEVNFNGGIINLQNGKNFYTTYGWYNTLESTTINTNGAEIFFNHISDNVVLDNAKIKLIEISGNGNVFTGNTEIIEGGTLYNYGGDYPILTIDGNLTNYGTIRNHSAGGNLRINVTGNLTYDGKEWSVRETRLCGSEDQSIQIPNDSVWTGLVNIDAMLTGTNFQWKKDGVDISGATSNVLTFNSGLTISDFGVYSCTVDGNSSRLITIGKESKQDLQISDVVITNLNETETKVEWKTTVPATGFIFYAKEDTTSGFPYEAMESSGLVTEHSLIIDTLTTGATYYFIIDQNDENWAHNVRSSTYSFVAGDIKHEGNTPFDSALASLQKLTSVPDEEGSAYYDGAFISNDIAYVVTSHNKLFKTTDGGENWTDVSPEQGTSFDGVGNCPKVHFFDANIGAVAFSVDDGANGYDYSKVFGYVWVTQDGGQTWSERFDVNDDQILHLEQASERVTYVSGPARFGVAGNKWFKKITYDPTNGTYSLIDITPTPDDRPHVMSGDWLDENNGIILAKLNYGSYNLSVFKTSDGGSSWTNINGNLPSIVSPQISFSDRGIQMIDENTFIFSYYYPEGDGYDTKIWGTENGGSSWFETPIADSPVMLNSLSLDKSADFGLICGFNTDSSKIFYVMYEDQNDWQSYLLPDVESGNGLFANEITADGTIWAIGNNKSIWKSKKTGTDVLPNNSVNIPSEYALLQNYPNPFNPSTVIEFAMPSSGNVSLKVFNSIGEEVAELINSNVNAGYHSVNFEAGNLSSGIYFYRIQAGNFIQTNKMLLVK